MINHWIVLVDNTESNNESVEIKSCQYPEELKYENLPVQFRMYDDDGNLYYSGRMKIEDFDPLDDYGMPNAGCTYLKYRRGNKAWEHL